ncbi:MAG TPA: site-specific integrase [Candidatus Saccharimonadales bacterium]|nr:site-specific integrase [Candidatus Saccharimonadales bacterium]
MIENYLRRPWVVARLRKSVLGEHLDILTDDLQKLGYKKASIQEHLYAAGHLAHWLARCHIAVRTLDEAKIRRFRIRHLPHCRCRIPRGDARYVGGVTPHLLRLLRSRGLIPTPIPPKPTPVDEILETFCQHLKKNRGLTSDTCDTILGDVRPFLRQLYGTVQLDLSKITVLELRRFVIKRVTDHSAHAGRRTASSLRSFLRFLQLQGLASGTLIQGVPMVRDSHRSRLPQALDALQLKKFLVGINRERPSGIRDYAMLLSLARLGLRANEVSRLRLEDIDWRVGTITIAFSKGRRASVLPLPQDVGRAITTYLRQGRPRTSERHVFVRHFMPVGAAISSRVVTLAVERAFRRAGIEAPSRGAHVLRHTAATEMVRGGASLKAVADVLRHRSIDTTAIYIKSDLPRLREIALPWLGAKS